MLWFSLAQSPKSINLHLSEQNGLKGNLSLHSTSLLQVGHFSLVGLSLIMVSFQNVFIWNLKWLYEGRIRIVCSLHIEGGLNLYRLL